MADEKLIFQIQVDASAAAVQLAKTQKSLQELTQTREKLTLARKASRQNLQAALKAEQESIKSKNKLQQEVKELRQAEGGNTEQIGLLTAQIAQLSDQQNEARISANKYAEELQQTDSNLKAVRKEINLTEKELQAVPGSIGQQRVELSRLKKEWANFRIGIDGSQEDFDLLVARINDLTDEIKLQEEQIQVFGRNVGNYKESIVQAFGEMPGPIGRVGAAVDNLKNTFKQLKALGPAGIAVAGIAGIAAATAAVANYGLELDQTRAKIKQFSGESGEDLVDLTATTTATASVFNQEATELAEATNSLFRQFEGADLSSQQEAAELIRKGFAAGADAGGEFLSVVKEYPAQLREAGLSANEAIALISQQPQTGVFSDKGVDAIKEGLVRIREFTPATQEALEGIGLSSDEIQKGLEEGTLSAFDVIQKVSGKLNELPPLSAEVGTAIADVFGGPGEDAGLQYLQSLQNINLNLDEVVANAGEAADSNLRIADATERINKQFLTLFEGSSETFKSLKAGALEFVADGLEFIIKNVVSLINFFIDLYNESTLIRGAFEALGAIGKTVFTTLKTVASNFFNIFKNIGQVVGAVLKGEFSRIPDIIKEGAAERRAASEAAGKEIAERWQKAYQNTVKRNKVALVTLSKEEVSEAEDQYNKSGQSMATAFGAGFEKVTLASLEETLSGLQARLQNTEIGTAAFSNIQKQIESLEARIERVKNPVKTISVDKVDSQALSEISSITIDLQALTEENNQRLAVDKEYIQKKLEQQALFLEKQKAEVQLDEEATAEERIQRTQELEEQIRQTKIQALELQLSDFQEGSEEALQVELEIIALRQAAKDEEAAADAARIEAAKRLEEERARLTLLGLRAVQNSTQGIIEAFGEQSAAGKAAIAIQKLAAAAEIGINLRRQISDAITAGAKISTKNPIAGAAYQVATIAAYTVQAGQLLAEVAGFEDGSFTDPENGKRLFVNGKGEIVTGGRLTFEGKTVAQKKTFADGGSVNSPTLGLIGERGPEYVVPARVLQTPEGAAAVAELEEIRRRKISAFETGGFTSPVKSSVPASIQDTSTQAVFQRLLQVEQRLLQQTSVKDSDRVRASVVQGLQESLQQVKSNISSISYQSQEQRLQSLEIASESIETISREIAAVKDSRLTEMLFESFASRDQSAVERAKFREQPRLQGLTVSSALSPGGQNRAESQPFVLDSLTRADDDAGPLIESIRTASVFPEGAVDSPVIAPLPGAGSYVIPAFVREAPEAQETIKTLERIRTASAAISSPGVVPFGSGGTTGLASVSQVPIAPQASGTNFDKLTEALAAMPSPVVSVEEIVDSTERFVSVQDDATI